MRTKRSEGKKLAIANLNIAGSVGKSETTKCMIETLRRKTNVDVYSLDENNMAVYNAYGQKNIPIADNDPTKGVKLISIRDPESRRFVIDGLKTDSEIVIYDTPADSISEFLKISEKGTVKGLCEFFEYDDFDLDIVTVIADEKSLDSYIYVKDLFQHPIVRHVAIINYGLLKQKGLKSMLPAINKEIGDGVHFLIDQELNKNILKETQFNSYREAYTPRPERTNNGVVFPKDDAYILKSTFDTVQLSGFIKETTAEIERIFL